MIVQADGSRLDRAVADWRGVSRAAVLRLLDQGAVICNGRVLGRPNKGDLLRVGDQLELLEAYAQGERPIADGSIAMEILAQGAGWLVVNKPAGMPVRPHTLDETGTVVNAIAAQYPKAIGVGEGGLRSAVVHRLDTETSGTLLVATEQEAWQRFRDAFAEHRFKKRYLALVHGLPADEGAIRRDLRITTHRPARVSVQPEDSGAAGARNCSLAWQVIERFGEAASLVEVDLHTGFLHQVRVMMNDLGHPVIGDQDYGRNTSAINAPRQMLHARSLTFEEVRAEAPVPEDMQGMIQTLRGLA